MEHGVINTNKQSSHDQQLSSPTSKLIIVASIAAGVQFGWALQLSLLTPYVQLLGVPHIWAAFIWLCGPLSGLVVQPIVGYHSDRCTSRWGRRRPFIVAGTALVSIAVFLIGFAADLGMMSGDTHDEKTKPRAVAIFVAGFWILDVANNILQGPCRALLADLSGHDHKKMRTANAFFSFFMAVGNILGYAAGSYSGLYHILPFTKTEACDIYCANLKACFIFSIALLLTVTTFAVILVNEKPHTLEADHEEEEVVTTPFFREVLGALKNLSRPMWILMLVTCLNWIGWFPFLLYDTDWMGTDVYGGTAKGNDAEKRVYDLGVRTGSLGLMMNSVMLGLVSLVIEPVGRFVGGTKRVWGIVNFVLAICLASTWLVTKMAESARASHDILLPPPPIVKASALTLFTVLGIPQAVTFSIPFAMASIYCNTSGGGQGLSLGVLNLSIVIPQMLVAVVSGPLDELFGGGNLPAFTMGAIAAATSGFLALFMLPNPPPHSYKILT